MFLCSNGFLFNNGRTFVLGKKASLRRCFFDEKNYFKMNSFLVHKILFLFSGHVERMEQNIDIWDFSLTYHICSQKTGQTGDGDSGGRSGE